MSKKIKIGTKVVVITGSYKGTAGKITLINGDLVQVDTLPKLKKGRKADPRKQIEAGFDMISRSIQISNVKPVLDGESK